MIIFGMKTNLYKRLVCLGRKNYSMNMQEIKDFIIWCKENKVKSFNNSDFHFELSDLAFIEDQLVSGGIDLPKTKEEFLDSQKTFMETEQVDEKEQEELLFWSSSK